MKQYVYDYAKVSCDLAGWGAFNGNSWEIGNHQGIINERAKEGWRYVGYIPTRQRGTGHIEEMDLIFEKEAE